MVLLRKSVAPFALYELEFVREASARRLPGPRHAHAANGRDAVMPMIHAHRITINQWPCRERSTTGEIHESTIASTTHKAQVTENTNRNGVRANRNMNERLPTAPAKYKYQTQRY